MNGFRVLIYLRAKPQVLHRHFRSSCQKMSHHLHVQLPTGVPQANQFVRCTNAQFWGRLAADIAVFVEHKGRVLFDVLEGKNKLFHFLGNFSRSKSHEGSVAICINGIQQRM